MLRVADDEMAKEVVQMPTTSLEEDTGSDPLDLATASLEGGRTDRRRNIDHRDARGGSITVERLDRSSIGAVAEILAVAFLDERVWSYVIDAPPRRRLRLQKPFFHGLARGYAAFSELHGAYIDGRLVGAGIRVPPGRWPLSRRERLTSTVWVALGLLPSIAADPKAAMSFFSGVWELERHHPHDRPHWHLAFVGVHPGFRRRGVATALGRFVLEQADAAGVGCYFETSGEETVALYERLGFEVRETIEPLPGGPMMWTMWREPEAAVAGPSTG
jgi:ribosomal protein S18 acetylase RimI-like enzyme